MHISYPALAIAVVFVIFVGIHIYNRLPSRDRGEDLQSILAKHGDAPSLVITSEANDVALCLDRSEQHLTYANALSGTFREIGFDEIASLEILENDVPVSHIDSAADPGLLDQIAADINSILPDAVQHKIERLEILLRTKTGGPPHGYRIPVVETEVSSSSRRYQEFRSEIGDLFRKLSVAAGH